MTMTLPSAAATTTTATTTTTLPINEPCCPNCGLSLPPPTSDPHTALLQAQRQIEDLQAQVRLLNQKATAAADRWADYEDELSRLRAASTSTNSTTATTSTRNNHNNNNHNTNNSSSSSSNANNRPHTPDPSVSNSSPRSSFLGAGAASRISQLLSPRKSAAPSSSTPPSTTPKSNTATTTPQQQQQRGSLSSPALPPGANAIEARELMTALARERRLRAAAEEKLAATDREVEDLSASLFEQANNMVATERRARAALEERLRELEQRDEEKRARIGRLEGAVMRIERVRDMLEDRDAEEEEEKEEGEETEREEEEKEQEQEKEERDEDNNRTREQNKDVEETDGDAKEGGR